MNRYIFTLVVFFSSFPLLHAATGKLEVLEVGRYTRQPGGLILVETGFLMAPTKGFVANKASTYPESLFAASGMTAASITAISGKAVAFKATIDGCNQINPGFLDNYTFSTQSYPTVGGLSYIVTLATGGGTTAPTANVSVTKTKLQEGPNRSSAFEITLSKAPTEDIVVLFNFSGTTKGSTDYLSSNNLGSVKIKTGKKTGKVTVTLRNDKLKEPKETITFKILAHGGYKLGKKTSATIIVTDDDK